MVVLVTEVTDDVGDGSGFNVVVVLLPPFIFRISSRDFLMPDSQCTVGGVMTPRSQVNSMDCVLME